MKYNYKTLLVCILLFLQTAVSAQVKNKIKKNCKTTFEGIIIMSDKLYNDTIAKDFVLRKRNDTAIQDLFIPLKNAKQLFKNNSRGDFFKIINAELKKKNCLTLVLPYEYETNDFDTVIRRQSDTLHLNKSCNINYLYDKIYIAPVAIKGIQEENSTYFFMWYSQVAFCLSGFSNTKLVFNHKRTLYMNSITVESIRILE
ncbi:MAG: hypothetical protein IPJ81_08610 [Chitinophagaceae bacterium]|nr:hypothetical protein [Chitinophagaceae bacterium]